MKFKTVIIVGLYRSGTSFLSKSLNAYGIPMWGEKGPTRHYEDETLLKFNNEELRRHKCDIASIIPDYKPSDKFLEQLRKYKAQREAKSVPYGLKAPRISNLFLAYKEVFDDAAWICCIRNFYNTSRSWPKRYGKDFEGKLISFSNQLQNVVTHLREEPNRHYFNYDGKIADEEERLNEFLGTKIDLQSKWNKRR
jgi:hypothetical protein